MLTALSYPSLYIPRIMLKMSHLWNKARIFLLITPASFPYIRNKTRLVTGFKKYSTLNGNTATYVLPCQGS